MAGIGKYKKGAKFTLKSGNTPLFKQMGSNTPLYANTNVSTTTSSTTTNNNNAEGGEENKEEETPVNPDKPLAKVGKVLFNAMSGGLNAIQKNKIKELKINWGRNEEKRKKEADADSSGEKAVNDIINKTGIWDPNYKLSSGKAFDFDSELAKAGINPYGPTKKTT